MGDKGFSVNVPGGSPNANFGIRGDFMAKLAPGQINIKDQLLLVRDLAKKLRGNVTGAH
jgi:hypothetical protein